MGVPGSRNSELGDLVGSTRQHIGIWKGPSPDRVDRLFWFVTSCRPPVNSTPQVCRGEDSTVVGDFDTSLTLGGEGSNVRRDADSASTGVGRDADGAPTGFERNERTAHVSDRV